MMIDTLEHIRQQNTYQQELWRIAVKAAAAEDVTPTQGLLENLLDYVLLLVKLIRAQEEKQFVDFLLSK
jgi:hypothetical protein